MLRCVDVYAVMSDGSRRLSFTGSVRTMIERHWSGKGKPKEEDIIATLYDEEEISIPMLFPNLNRERLDWDHDVHFRALFRPMPQEYVATGRFTNVKTISA